MDLDRLLHDAVDDVDPAYRLPAIRARAARPSRRRWYAAATVTLVAAAAVGVVGVVGAVRPGDDGPEPSRAVTDGPATRALAVYYLGDTSRGPRLFREFHPVSAAAQPLDQALAALTAAPDDGDYRTLWPADAFGGIRVVDDTIEVIVDDEGLVGAPTIGGTDAQESVQQVVYTLQAAAGRELPVRFTYQGTLAPRILGISTAQPFTRAPEDLVLADVSVSDPVEGRAVRGAFSAGGRSLGPVSWTLTAPDGRQVTAGRAPVQGAGATTLGTWQVDGIDVSDQPPGAYVFTARSHGAADTRTVQIQ